jgi:hypothetical protein
MTIKLKRYPIKYIRDRAKSRYVKDDSCFICGATESLDFHHFTTLSDLFNRWAAKHRLEPEDILDYRDRFIEEHEAELFELAVTLCHNHHLKLHSIYGKNPSLGTASKQARWVQKQRDKHGLESV